MIGSGPFCNLSAPSLTATIILNGARPVLTIGPQVGYQGASYCNKEPVTMYATLNAALGCIESYTWKYPSGWSVASQSGNSITLIPSGTVPDPNNNKISADVKFTCGTTISSGNYVPPFNKPSITVGSWPICNSGSTFYVNYAPLGSTITWTATPSNLFNLSSGTFTSVAGINSFVVKTATTYFNGPSTVTISVVNPCASNLPSAEVSGWAGPPTQPGPISGETNPSIGGIISGH